MALPSLACRLIPALQCRQWIWLGVGFRPLLEDVLNSPRGCSRCARPGAIGPLARPDRDRYKARLAGDRQFNAPQCEVAQDDLNGGRLPLGLSKPLGTTTPWSSRESPNRGLNSLERFGGETTTPSLTKSAQR